MAELQSDPTRLGERTDAVGGTPFFRGTRDTPGRRQSPQGSRGSADPFDFPVEHWIHLRTANVIESTFATVRLRPNKTKGAGSRSAGLALAYKLLDAAQARWRCVNAPHLVALVRAESTVVDPVTIEREDQPYAA
jgi:hypothetical protein